MLKAIEHGKMARWIDDEGQQVSAIAAYRDHEDHLTAAVFSRLSYLPTDLLWRVLSQAADGAQSDSCLSARPRLTQIEFWPRLATDDTRVEPDVQLSFATFELIVEAKRRDERELQTRHQIQNEVLALRNEVGDRRIYCLLVSGRLEESLDDIEGLAGLMTTSWFRLRLAAADARAELSYGLDHHHLHRILSDIDKALALHGVRPKQQISDIERGLEDYLWKQRSLGILWPSLG
ncbi:MAG: hypothetical protein PF501_10140 [Salinisphaera sp.]|jgi:hypothetical protein|nr:hypothetical protein [Salinisphaera sp.]